REPGVCGLTCIFSSGCLPMIALHLGVFYGSSTFVIVLRRLGLMPTPTEKSPEFKCSFYTGWHLPGAIMSFPIALQGILAMAELAGTDSDAQASALASPFVQEGCTWFYVYLLVDTVLITLHGIGSKEIYVHHLIFLLIGVALVEGEKMGGQCCMALNGRKEGLMAAGLLTQEASTPLLNLFMLLRAFKGLEHTLTQIAFMLFAVLFFVFRIVIICYITSPYLYNNWSDPNNCVGSPLRWLVWCAALLGNLGLQLNWFNVIGKRAIPFFFPKKSSSKGSHKSE
ncbi:unnamed protein product, partial [Polarella glacialis]